MLALAFVAIVVYAVIDAFGAWAVIRRKRWLAALFMLAASVLVVSAVAMVSVLPFALVLLAAGLALSSLASLLYARIVVGRVRWHHHAVRAAIAVAIFLVAQRALL